MKRYTAFDPDGDTCLLESPNGPWVLHSDAQAEIERLRGLVVEACVKGFCQALPYTPSEATMRLVREWAVVTRHRLELGTSTAHEAEQNGGNNALG